MMKKFLPLIFLPLFIACNINNPPEPPTGPTGTKTIPTDDDSKDDSGEYAVVDEECGGTDREDYPSYFATAMFRSISQQGNTAYLVDGSHLWALDMNNPLAPKLIGRWGPIGHAIKVQTVNTMVYISAVDQGFLIVDMASLTIVGRYIPHGYIMDAYIRPPYAFLAAGKGGLKVLDISTPDSPTEIGSLDTPGYAAGIHVSGSTAFMADCSSLEIVSILEPANPFLMSSISIPGGNAKEVFAEGGFAFVADNGHGLYAIDVKDQSNPRLAGQYDIPEMESFYVNGVVVSKGYAYIASGNLSLSVVNVSDPYSLVPQKGYPVDPIGVALSGSTVYSLGNYRYSGKRKVDAFDISTPGSLRFISSFSQSLSMTTMAFDGEYVIALHEGEGLFIVDAAKRTVADRFIPLTRSIDIKAAKNHAYIMDENRRISIVSYLSPPAPYLAGSMNNILAWLYAIDGDRLYIYGSRDGKDDNEILIYSIASPSSPSFLGSYIPDSLYGMAASGNYLYLIKGFDVDVIDVSNPNSPKKVSSFTTTACWSFLSPEDTEDEIFAVSNVLYQYCDPGDSLEWLLGGKQRQPYIEAYDIRDPLHVKTIDTLYLPSGSRHRMAVVGDFLYVLSSDNDAYMSSLGMFQRLRVPIKGLSSSFLKHSTYSLSGYPNSIASLGDNLYIFDDDLSLRIIDISVPLFLREKGQVLLQ